MISEDRIEQMADNIEEGFLKAMENMDDKEYKRYKMRYPMLTPFLASLWWKKKHDPDFEIDYDDVDNMMEKQFAYDQALLAATNNSESFTNLTNEYQHMTKIKASKFFVDAFKRIEKATKKLDDQAAKLQEESQFLWKEFSKKYKTKNKTKKPMAFRFENGKFFAIIEEKGKGRK